METACFSLILDLDDSTDVYMCADIISCLCCVITIIIISIVTIFIIIVIMVITDAGGLPQMSRVGILRRAHKHEAVAACIIIFQLPPTITLCSPLLASP